MLNLKTGLNLNPGPLSLCFGKTPDKPPQRSSSRKPDGPAQPEPPRTTQKEPLDKRLNKVGFLASGLSALAAVLGLAMNADRLPPTAPEGYSAHSVRQVGWNLKAAQELPSSPIPEIQKWVVDRSTNRDVQDMQTFWYGLHWLAPSEEVIPLRHLLNDKVFWGDMLDNGQRKAMDEAIIKFRGLGITALNQKPQAEKAIFHQMTEDLMAGKATPQQVKEYQQLVDKLYEHFQAKSDYSSVPYKLSAWFSASILAMGLTGWRLAPPDPPKRPDPDKPDPPEGGAA